MEHLGIDRLAPPRQPACLHNPFVSFIPSSSSPTPDYGIDRRLLVRVPLLHSADFSHVDGALKILFNASKRHGGLPALLGTRSRFFIRQPEVGWNNGVPLVRLLGVPGTQIRGLEALRKLIAVSAGRMNLFPTSPRDLFG